LVSYEARLSDGTEVFPFGVGVAGMIIWDSDGAFSAQISPGAATAGVELRYVAYYGTWEFDEASAELLHHVDGSVNPDLQGTILRRQVTFDGDRVTLTPPPTEVDGMTRTMSLIWERERRTDSGP
jgi:hypothetical protein